MARRTKPQHACPRCGYDQSGAIATWSDACPVHGQCSECGLEFRWLHIFHPDRDRIRGFFEHARGLRQSLSAIPRTIGLIARPRTFWTRVQMHMAPNLRRAAAFILITLFAVYAAKSLLLISAITAESLRTGVWSRGPWLFSDLVLAALVYPPLEPSPPGVMSATWSPPRWWVAVPVIVLSTALWAASFVLLPETRRRAKVRRAHVARAFTYSCIWLALPLLPWVLEFLLLLSENLFDLAGVRPPGLVRRYSGFATELDWNEPNFGQWFALTVWLWLAYWWFHAIRRGFQLQHAWGVWLALLALNAAATLPFLWYWSDLAMMFGFDTW